MRRLKHTDGFEVKMDEANTKIFALLDLQEDDNAHFFELVERLKAGEKIPNACLTRRGTVALFVP